MDIAVSRKEDMSYRGQLKVLTDAEGDIHVAVFCDDGDGNIDSMASIEFCNCGIGGGKSPNTMKALRELMKAMELDNQQTPSRAGDL
jgi:hypothetical protein